jgi:GNAT superfamily N-acetyltransferase
MLLIRPAHSADSPDLHLGDEASVWAMLEPVLRAAEVFALPADMDRASALAYWFAAEHTVFIAEEDGEPVGSYYIQANQRGAGSHVANCGYLTAPSAVGRGIAGAMCAHSLEFARASGYRAMQFNFVISSNAAAVHLWTKHGFTVLARLPGAFRHPRLGFVDALVMHREL